jgi:hypothetical protein
MNDRSMHNIPQVTYYSTLFQYGLVERYAASHYLSVEELTLKEVIDSWTL